jgi:hypothetical protein
MEVASGRGYGKRSAGREKMIKRFFFYRVHMDRAGITIDQGMINPLPVFPDLTVPSPPRPNLALAGT